jgi:hypothetical protein
MRRVRWLAAVLLAAVLPGTALAASAAPRAHLDRIVCHRALDPAARYVSVTAVMRPLPGTVRMEVRFDLLQRLPGAASFAAVTAPGLGDWISPGDPTLGQRPGDVWKVIKPVADLDAPAVYRFLVNFRWTGSGGRVLGMAMRLTRGCTQRELRPDLVVNSIQVAADPGHPQLDDYLVEIADTGPTGAGPFSVAFTDAGHERDRVVSHIAAHASLPLKFVGPVCDSADPPSATVDPQDQIDVSSRAQATQIAVCPTGPA